VIAFLNVKTRQVVLSPATFHPDETWVVAQAESFVQKARGDGLPVAILQHDRDTKFTKTFDRALKRSHLTIMKGACRSPNTNAFVERFIQSIEQECLVQFVIFGEKHLNHLCQEYLAYYHHERPYQALDNEPLKRKTKGQRKARARPDAESDVIPLNEVRCKQRLGGLLKHYYRTTGPRPRPPAAPLTKASRRFLAPRL
jgi:putative transposase